MKKSILTLSALALIVSLSANAQDAGDVQVSGSIAPTPCTISVSDTALTAPATFLDALAGTGLPNSVEHFVPELFTLTVACSTTRNFGLRATGSNQGTKSDTFFADGDLDTVYSGASDAGMGSFPLLAAGAQEPGGYLALAFNSGDGSTDIRQILPSGVLTNAASANYWYPLINFDAKRPSLNGRTIRMTHTAGEDIILPMRAGWLFDDNFLNVDEPTHLSGNINLEIIYL